MDNTQRHGRATQIAALLALCEQIGEVDADLISERAVAMSEDKHLSADIRSLAIDTMLVAQGDFQGEFTSKEDLLSAVRRLR